MNSAEVTRYHVEGGERREYRHFEINLANALHGDSQANITLEPYDAVVVRRISNWNDTASVTVRGEVAHPGVYQIEDGEKLSSLLRRVGGYTPDAYLPAAVFTRESVRQTQQKQIDDLARRMEAELSVKQAAVDNTRDQTLKGHQEQALNTAAQMVAVMKTTGATGRLEIDLKDIAELEKSSQDIRLHSGDMLIIPKRPDEVYAIGEVYTQAAQLYNPDYDRSDYLEQAGLTRLADEGAIYVVRANGRIDSGRGGFFSSKNRIQPGDTIVVPTDLDHINMLDLVLDWSRALMQTGTSMAAMKAIGMFK